MKSVYSLRSENLSNLGGRMGTEYTYDNFIKYFDTIEKAKEYAEKEYGKKIHWMDKESDNRTIGNLVLEPGDVIIVRDENGNERIVTANFHNTESIYSGDLGYVMYHINPIEIT